MEAVLVGAGVVVLLDQGTKSLALRLLAPAGAAGAGSAAAGPAPRHSKLFAFTVNPGLWLGRAPALPALLALWITALISTLLVLATSTASPSHRLAGAALVLALGGATSNLLDRIRRGAVIDFIALGPWPPFNLADVAIVTGVTVAVLAAAL